MFDRLDARDFGDLLLPMGRRAGRGVYFVRVCGWGDGVKAGLWAFHEAARQKGVVLEGQIANPDERQLGYLNETLGTAFEPTEAFLLEALKKWMPRMGDGNRREFARALLAELDGLRRRGKPEGVLRNVYCKAMCWLYYKFERLMPFLGEDDPPRVLYETAGVTAHELMLLRLLNAMGADVLLLEPDGDAPYLKQDPKSDASQLLVPAGTPFPEGFSLKRLRKEMAAQARPAQPPAKAAPQQPAVPRPQGPAKQAAGKPAWQGPQPAGQRPAQPTVKRAAPPVAPARRPAKSVDPLQYFQAPARRACTNAWMQQAAYAEILTPVVRRGEEKGLFYNAFIRLRGVPDKLTYLSELHQFYQQFQATGRKLLILDGGLPGAEPEEIAKIRRHPYRAPEEMMVDLAGNLPACASAELQRLMQRAFVETLQEAAKAEGKLSRLVNAAVYLLCWIQRYQAALFQGYREGDVPCLVLMGGCADRNEALYPLFLSRLPVDILILAPDLNRPCAVADPRLLELTGNESLPLMKFPRDAGSLQVRTAAAHAEDDLTDILYTDSGLYRDRQFSRAEALTLHTTYDELFILWNQELKYRSGFATMEKQVTMPVLYAKVSGVEKGQPEAYWQKVKLLLGKDTYLVPRMPMVAPGTPNPFQSLAVKALRDGRLNRKRIREDRQYPFGLLREELQEHILDKVQLMLDRKLIKGTFVNGTEYTVLATVLNMDRALMPMLQSFDFTKKNPKLVCVATGDRGASLEDAILLTFLNLAGFDVVQFVPTGYQTIEPHLNDDLPVEHQAGEYMYDMTVPDFNALPQPKGRSWLNSIWKRGN